jgi:hypothetical protein
VVSVTDPNGRNLRFIPRTVLKPKNRININFENYVFPTTSIFPLEANLMSVALFRHCWAQPVLYDCRKLTSRRCACALSVCDVKFELLLMTLEKWRSRVLKLLLRPAHHFKVSI